MSNRRTDRQTDDGHKVIGKALADIVSWANNIICQKELIAMRPNIFEILGNSMNIQKCAIF